MKILMVCLGNICRSPLAEGILRKKAADEGLNIDIDSAGVSDYHTGECPDHRTQKNAMSHGIDLSGLRARQFVVDDFDRFDRIYIMDTSHFNHVSSLARNANDLKKIRRILDHIHPGKNMDVPDPYFGGEEGFENVFQMLDNACDQIIDELKNE